MVAATSASVLIRLRAPLDIDVRQRHLHRYGCPQGLEHMKKEQRRAQTPRRCSTPPEPVASATHEVHGHEHAPNLGGHFLERERGGARRWRHEHGHGGLSKDTLGRRAEEQLPDATESPTAHDDEVAVTLARDAEDFRRRRARRDLIPNLDVLERRGPQTPSRLPTPTRSGTASSASRTRVSDRRVSARIGSLTVTSVTVAPKCDAMAMA